MFEYFQKLWDLEMQKLKLSLDYWYIGVGMLIIIIVTGFIIYKYNK